MSMICRISDSGEDSYVGMDDDGNFVLVELDNETGEQIRSTNLYEVDDVSVSSSCQINKLSSLDEKLSNLDDGYVSIHNDLLYAHIDVLRKMYGGKL